MTKHISRHKDKSVDPTGILEQRANEDSREALPDDEPTDAERLDELDGWLEDGGGGVFDAADAAMFIARRLLAENKRLRAGIEKEIEEIINHQFAPHYFAKDLRALLGDS